jgi:hypothetical protein
MSDTPRTDAIAHRGYHLDALAARSIDLCRELERENAALREKISELEKAFAPNFVRELHIACIELERENAALLKALKEIAAYGPHDGSCGYGCDLPGIAMAAIDAARKEEQP